MVTTPNDEWALGMRRYWSRIYRFLDSRVDMEYRFSTLTGMLGPSYARTEKPRDGLVTLTFHPALLDRKPKPSLLIGTLAHEGLHAIMLTLIGESSLRPAQAQRLISSHWVGQRPPGYARRLVRLHRQLRSPDETGIELLTNKLLIQHGFRPLRRRASDGEYI